MEIQNLSAKEKNQKAKMKYKVKKVKYIDSAVNANQDNQICEPFMIESVGFVVKETKEYVTLASEILSNGDFRNQTSIPKIAIKKIK